MNKKGQVTMFIVIGVILVILLGLFFFVRDYYGVSVPVKTFLQGPKQSIERNVRDCVSKEVVPGLVLLGEQGGYMDPVNYKLYNGKAVTYLCKKPDCVNNLRPLSMIEDDLADYLSVRIDACIDKNLLESRRGFSIKDASMDIDVILVGSEVIVVVDYPVEIRKGGTVERLSRIKEVVNVPFAELYDVAYDIVSAYAIDGGFYHLPYMLLNKGAYEIRVDRPYPDIIYMINKKDSDYRFYMAVEG